MDLDRIPLRNLSRDDRVISSHTRDARYPYLDLGFIKYVSSLPMWQKCNFALGPGHGDKLLIRLAAERCGLPLTSHRVKRAMQFGTKSAGYRSHDRAASMPEHRSSRKRLNWASSAIHRYHKSVCTVLALNLASCGTVNTAPRGRLPGHPEVERRQHAAESHHCHLELETRRYHPSLWAGVFLGSFVEATAVRRDGV
jgi:asparagine synthetase B (glutamine-hydrolysing)